MKKLFRIIVIIIFISPLFLPDPGEMDMNLVLAGCTHEHLLGTDALGRDLLSRAVAAGRNSLIIAGTSAFLASSLGFLIGTVSLTSKVLDEVLMRCTDAVKALPAVLLSSLLMVTSGGGVLTLVIVMSAVFMPQCARLVRSEGRKQLASGYFEAAIVSGLIPGIAMIRTVMRHTLPLLKAQIPFIFSSACILESTLSFIGAGVSAETPTLGQMISDGRTVFITHPRLVLIPLGMLIFFTLCFSLQWKKMSIKYEIGDEKSS